MQAIFALLKKVPGQSWIYLGIITAFLSMFAYANAQRAKVAELAFEKDSVEASADTLKAFVHGHYTLYVKRSIQVSLDRDSLNKALKTIPKARVSAVVSIQTVHDTVPITVPVVESGDSLLTMAFADTTHPPFSLRVEAIANLNTKSANFTYAVGVAPFHMGVRLDCGAELNGVRPALVSFDLPSFLRLAVDSSSQSKEVCSPKPSLLDNGNGSTAKRTSAIFVIGGLLGAATYRFLSKRFK